MLVTCNCLAVSCFHIYSFITETSGGVSPTHGSHFYHDPPTTVVSPLSQSLSPTYQCQTCVIVCSFWTLTPCWGSGFLSDTLRSLKLIQKGCSWQESARYVDHITPIQDTFQWLPRNSKIDFKILPLTYEALRDWRHHTIPRPPCTQSAGWLAVLRISLCFCKVPRDNLDCNTWYINKVEVDLNWLAKKVGTRFLFKRGVFFSPDVFLWAVRDNPDADRC